jgi:UDP-N-acetylmuramoyl-L-alanyl-D-glutamate--2,6-diaminopimelate ligase
LGKLIGTFNAYNVLAIYGTAVELGMDSLETLRLLSELESVSEDSNTLFLLQISQLLLISYSDALENVLKTTNDITKMNS